MSAAIRSCRHRRRAGRRALAGPLLAGVLLLTALGIAIPGAHAQEDEAAEDVDWYRVEVIVFRQPPLPDEPLEAPPLQADAPPGRPLETLRTGADGETPFARLPRGAYGLTDVAARLERQPGFQVLLHTAWEQPGLGRDAAPYVPLPLDVAFPRDPGDASDDAPGPFAALPPEARLYGTLRLYRERYLHFETDLRYRLPDTPPAAVRMDEALAVDSAYDPTLHVMTASRRMRSEELHYLDHPVLGIVVRAVPLEE